MVSRGESLGAVGSQWEGSNPSSANLLLDQRPDDSPRCHAELERQTRRGRTVICLRDEQRGTKPASTVYARRVMTDGHERASRGGSGNVPGLNLGGGFKATHVHANPSLCTPRICTLSCMNSHLQKQSKEQTLALPLCLSQSVSASTKQG